MPFVTLRHKDWVGGDVSIDTDGDFIVVQLRDPNPIRGYMIVNLRTGQVVEGTWSSLFDAQKAAEAFKST